VSETVRDNLDEARSLLRPHPYASHNPPQGLHKAQLLLMLDIAESLRCLRPPPKPAPVRVPNDSPDRSGLAFGGCT
jgi:hypothetical protein